MGEQMGQNAFLATYFPPGSIPVTCVVVFEANLAAALQLDHVSDAVFVIHTDTYLAVYAHSC